MLGSSALRPVSRELGLALLANIAADRAPRTPGHQPGEGSAHPAAADPGSSGGTEDWERAGPPPLQRPRRDGLHL
jgi:hypothetical protein